MIDLDRIKVYSIQIDYYLINDLIDTPTESRTKNSTYDPMKYSSTKPIHAFLLDDHSDSMAYLIILDITIT